VQFRKQDCLQLDPDPGRIPVPQPTTEVMTDIPNWDGKSSNAMPDFSTNRIASSTFRCCLGWLPSRNVLASFCGRSNGSTTAQN
jgi:hypothetical protein